MAGAPDEGAVARPLEARRLKMVDTSRRVDSAQLGRKEGTKGRLSGVAKTERYVEVFANNDRSLQKTARDNRRHRIREDRVTAPSSARSVPTVESARVTRIKCAR